MSCIPETLNWFVRHALYNKILNWFQAYIRKSFTFGLYSFVTKSLLELDDKNTSPPLSQEKKTVFYF